MLSTSSPKKQFPRSSSQIPSSTTIKYGFAAIGVIILAAVSANAEIIAEDDFTYADGSLTGLNGGTGWAGAYTGGTSLQLGGGQISDSGGPGEVGTNFRALSQTINLTNFAGGEIWMGFDGEIVLEGIFGFAGISPFDGGTEKGIIGATGGRDSFGIGDTGNTNPTGSNRTVVLFNLNTNAISLWVGAIGSTVDVSAAADQTGNFNIKGTDNLRFALNSTLAGGSIAIDNFVLATTSAEVTTAGPLPDPDTDNDGLTDDEETLMTLTNPALADTDLDGMDDGAEIALGYDPLSNTSTPPTGSALSGVTALGSVASYLDGILPVKTPGGGSGVWATQEAFPSLGAFAELIGVVPEPLTNNIWVLERRGTVQRVDDNTGATTKTQVMDIQGLIEYGDNGGIRTLVFHPDFNAPASPNKDYVYLFYSTKATAGRGFSDADNSFFYRVSRFTRVGGTIDNSTELVMIQQKSRDHGQHFGGGMVFDADGFLCIGWGDMEYSTSGSHPVGVPFYQDVQRIDRIFQGALLRIDVNQTAGISSAPVRTLQGNTGPNASGAGVTQSCPSGHNYYHADNHSGVGYTIPLTNFWHASKNVPAAGTGGTFQGVSYPAHGAALEEHIAVGLRNPWRLFVDPVDGDVGWACVGSNTVPISESTDLLVNFQSGVVGGGNYGWPYREADRSETSETGHTKPPGGNSFGPVYLGTEQDPIFHYRESQGRTAVGGVFYQGSTFGTIPNKLVVGDHLSGKIWSVDYKGGGTALISELIDTSVTIRQMTATPDGEGILLAGQNDIFRLIDTSPSTPEPPATLSATGFFTSLANLTPRAGALAYEPIAPLWSDRAKKPRFFAVPNDLGTPGEYDHGSQKVTFSENSAWGFPIGTVFVKQFTLPLDEGDPDNPALQKKVETRFLVRGEDGDYYGFTYKWKDDQTDADLIPPGDTSTYDQGYTITREDNTTYTQTWQWPSRSSCFDCHQQSAGMILGPQAYQLNGKLHYTSTGKTANQLATMKSLNMFEQPLSLLSLESYPKGANIEDSSATMELRVRSYLTSNCAHCHQPGAADGRAEFDLRFSTPLSLTGLINGIPKAGGLGLSSPELIKPGDFINSVLYHRDKSIDPSIMMPPIAKSIEDEKYIELLGKWIERIGYTNFDTTMTSAGVIGGLHDDDDGDGLRNKEEFLFGFDPMVPDLASIYNLTDDGGVIRANIPLKGAALSDGINMTVWGSNDLSNWFHAGMAGSILSPVSDTSAPGMDGIQIWEFDPAPRGFMKLEVTP